MREKLAREPFEEKIRKVSEMIRLRKSIKRTVEQTGIPEITSASAPKQKRLIVSAIKNKEVLSFSYSGVERIVEPQTYGISVAGHEVLRARQVGGGSQSGQSRIAKLFDVEKISGLKKTGAHFSGALPEHNPNDSAMVEVFASLPKPKRKQAAKT